VIAVRALAPPPILIAIDASGQGLYDPGVQDAACPCVICGGVPRGRDAAAIATVEQHGWCALLVPGTVDFAYTVGLWHSFQIPEIVMFGLAGKYMQLWLNPDLDGRVERGAARTWQRSEAERSPAGATVQTTANPGTSR